MSIQRENVKRLGDDAKIGLALAHATDLTPMTGEVFIEVVDPSNRRSVAQ